jgi:hypothetical protein
MCWKLKSSEAHQFPFLGSLILSNKLALLIVHVVKIHYLSPTFPMFSTMGYLFLMIKGGLPKVDFSS